MDSSQNIGGVHVLLLSSAPNLPFSLITLHFQINNFIKANLVERREDTLARCAKAFGKPKSILWDGFEASFPCPASRQSSVMIQVKQRLPVWFVLYRSPGAIAASCQDLCRMLHNANFFLMRPIWDICADRGLALQPTC